MADRQFFVQPDEVLLAFDQNKQGVQYSRESMNIGSTWALDWLLDEFSDECIRIIRFNTVKLTGEDVTEQVASSWLRRFKKAEEKAGFAVTPSDEMRFPDFVKASSAWETLKYRLEMSIPIEGPDNIHSATHERRLLAYIDTVTVNQVRGARIDG